jgi:ParB/RepB/Spo0J family partition protein
MKIKVSAIRPNPFRHIEKYPILEEKVEALKTSISETEFWDNIVVRRASEGDKIAYELAYGHHRLEALKALGIEEIDIPVKDIEDAMMLKIMANENMDSWKSNPAVIMETVSAAKEFLDAELAKYETLEQFMAGKNTSHIADSAKSFSNLKRDGVGRMLS